MVSVTFIGEDKSPQIRTVMGLTATIDIPSIDTVSTYSTTSKYITPIYSTDTYCLETVRDYVQDTQLQKLVRKDHYFYVHESVQNRGTAAMDAFNENNARSRIDSMLESTHIVFIGGSLDNTTISSKEIPDTWVPPLYEEERYYLLTNNQNYDVRFYLSSKEMHLISNKEELTRRKSPWLLLSSKPKNTRK